MASLLEPTLTPSTLHKLQARRSYMASAPYQQRKTKKRLLNDLAMKLCPVILLGPVIIRLHDVHQYKKDRKHVQEVYVEYQAHRSRKGSAFGASGSGSVADLRTYLAPVEWRPFEELGGRRDLWRSGEMGGGEVEDPWQLPPANEIV